MENKNRLSAIKNLKTMMMLVVVLYHCCLFFTGNWFHRVRPVYSAGYITFFSGWLNTFHVQTFTMASGFLFYYQRTEQGKHKSDALQDIRRRGRRLLRPYCVTAITWVIPFYIYYNGVDLTEIVKKYFLGYAPSQLWFLLMLFWIYGICYFLFDKIPLSFKGMIKIAVLSFGGGILLDKAGLNIFQISTAVKYLFFYFSGAFLYAQKDRKTERKDILISCACSVGMYSIVFLLGQKEEKYDILKAAVMVITFFCSAAGVYMVYSAMICFQEKLDHMRYGRLWNALGNNSFGIYLFHQQIIYLTIIPLNGKVPPVMQVGISFITAICAAGLIASVLRKWNMTKALYGL